MPIRLSAAGRRNKIIHLFQKRGFRPATIANKVGVTEGTVRKHLLREGLIEPKQQQKRRPEIRTEIKKMFRKGLSKLEISRRTGVPETSVRRILNERNRKPY